MSESFRTYVRDHWDFPYGSLAHEKTRARKRHIPEHKWATYRSSLSDYNNFFSNVTEGKTIQELVADKQKLIVVDLMSSSTAIAGLLDETQVTRKKGIAVSLADIRSDEEKGKDERLNIVQLQGDLGKSSTWKNIQVELESEKVDLIIERGNGGLRRIPIHPLLYSIAAQRMWNMLDINGILLLEISTQQLMESGISAKELSGEFIRNKILVRQGSSYNGSSDRNMNLLFVQKLVDSPTSLPYSGKIFRQTSVTLSE